LHNFFNLYRILNKEKNICIIHWI